MDCFLTYLIVSTIGGLIILVLSMLFGGKR